jgi:hypothetical protein
MTSRNVYALAASLAILACLMMAYVIAALGLIADEGDRADMVYLTVFGAGLVGAAVARLRPAGMARTLFIMAAVQGVIGAVVVIIQLSAFPLFTAMKVLVLNGFFVAMFAAAGWLFLQAARPGGAQTLTDNAPG